MKVVKFVSKVDPAKCTGDKLCERVCPTGAIRVIDKKARVMQERCVACSKCYDRCRSEAVAMVPRPEPVVLRTDPQTVDQDKILELCLKAKMLPGQLVCMCTGTLAKEIAAAILQGARSLEELSLKTGARSGCGIYCIGSIQRMFEAAGLRVTSPEDHRMYDLTLSMFDVPVEVQEKYPAYYLREDTEILK
ncbi:MAG: (2Fe-2S)-binding protein [bacterium]